MPSMDWSPRKECEDVFRRTMELGIENTMRALIEAGVEDSAMVSALCEVWGVAQEGSCGEGRLAEAEDRH